MPLTGQIAGWGFAKSLGGDVTGTITVQIPKSDAFAEIAQFWLWVVDEDTHTHECTISQVVSDSGIEDFDVGVPVAYRENMDSVTFRFFAYRSYVEARFMIDLR